MKRSFGIGICLALLLWGAPLRAQWSGSLELSGGLSGMEGSIVNDEKPMFHGLAQGVFVLDYHTDKFRWTSTLSGSWEPNTTDNGRMAYKNGRLNITYKSAATKPLSVKYRSDFLWTPSGDRNYKVWLQYQYANDRARNHSLTFDGSEEEMENFSYYYEVPILNKHGVEAGLRTFRSFDSGRSILNGSLVLQAGRSRTSDTWTVFKMGEDVDGEGGTAVSEEDIQGVAWKYRITPYSTDFDLNGDVHLQRTLSEGAVSLKFAPGLRVATQHALDENSGATRINMSVDDDVEEIWRDSTRLRENFNFLSVRGEPYLTADFKWKNLEAHADYACQVYARRLNDDSHRQALKVKGVYPVGNANIKWTISERHSLRLTNQLDVSHPDYLKICWYDRTAGYLDQLYRGNERLLSPKTQRYALEFGYRHNRFLSRSSVSFTHVANEIDQTWSNEEIDGRDYKIFRWINSSDSRSAGLAQQFGWQGKVITADLGVTYNQSSRKAKNGDTVKNSFNWTLNGDIDARLGKGWSLGADAHYRSKVATFFTIFKEYCELNVHVRKDLKRFTLYLEGRDLLDQEKQATFESEELQEAWIEEVRYNRRIVVLGVKWKF